MNYTAKEIIKRDWYKSYPEFYFTLAFGRVLHERGGVLDVTGMKVDSKMIPDDMIKYYKRMVNDGMLHIDGYTPKVDIVVPEKAFCDYDVDYFKEIQLYEETPEERKWDTDYAVKAYGSHKTDFMGGLSLGYNIINMVSWHLVDVLEGITTKKLHLYFDKSKTKNVYTYILLYTCLHTIDWLNDYIEISLELGGTKVDLEYSIFCNNASVSKYHRVYSVTEKVELMKKYGMEVGSILVIYSRDGMCENNPYGRVFESSVVRLDEIGDDFLGVTQFCVNKTKEEIITDYEAIDDDKKHLFVDILDFDPKVSSTEESLYDMGIDAHFLDESKFICKLDNYAKVTKMVTIEGKVVMKEMSEIDALYWLFCQYELEFDKELYIRMYYHNQIPLWDQCYGEEGVLE